MDKITVIIVCYNSERTLSEAISSVRMQTWQNLEIIIVDDGSGDHSVQIAEHYARLDKRIRLIRHTENRGILAARKTGILAASGTWIMHLDADDLLKPEACEKSALAIRNQAVDFVQFGTKILAETEMSPSEIMLKEKKLCSDSISIDCTRLNADNAILNACYREHRFTYTQWNKIYRAELLKKACVYFTDERICMGEDMYALFVVMSLARKMSVIEDQLYIYRFGGGVSCADKNAPMKSFLHSCETMKAVRAIRQYALEKDAEQGDERLGCYVPLIRKDMLHRTITRFYPLLCEEQKQEVEHVMRSLWTEKELACYREFERGDEVA